MKANCVKIVGSFVALVTFGLLCMNVVHAQQGVEDSSSSAVTTNWVGYLVAGRSDAFDRITPNPFPAVVGQVEIGLRSDGVVIWREVAKAK